jgi:hypothetical protein
MLTENLDANTYGFDGKYNAASVFNRSGDIQTLAAPGLNITSTYTAAGFSALAELFNGVWNGNSDASKYIRDDISKAMWIWKGEVYNISYVLSEGECLPTMTHNWGFSFLGLFIALVFTATWSIGMYIMWLDAYLNSRFSRANRNLAPIVHLGILPRLCAEIWPIVLSQRQCQIEKSRKGSGKRGTVTGSGTR